MKNNSYCISNPVLWLLVRSIEMVLIGALNIWFGREKLTQSAIIPFCLDLRNDDAGFEYLVTL